jgi:hypothetical protein
MAFHTQFRAVIQCDWELDDGSWGCTHTEEYKAEPSGCSIEQFAEDAKEHFIREGWQIVPDFRCQHCKGRRTDIREDDDDE